MEWSEHRKAKEGESYYDNVVLVSPIGTFKIEWKSWKERPSFDLTLDFEWIGSEYTLNEAKDLCLSFLTDKADNLNNFLLIEDND